MLEAVLKGGQGWSRVQQPLWCPCRARRTTGTPLPGDSEPTEQAKEILILRHKSLLVEVSGSDTCSSRKEVRGSTGEQDRAQAAFPTAWLLLVGFPLKDKSCYFKLKQKKRVSIPNRIPVNRKYQGKNSPTQLLVNQAAILSTPFSAL